MAELCLPRAISSSSGLMFDVIGIEHLDEVVDFLMKYFFPVVPIGHIVNMDVEMEVRPWIRDFISAILNEGHTLSIRDPSERNQLAAICVNQLEIQTTTPLVGVQILNSIDHEKNPLMLMNATFLEALGGDVDFFAKYSVERVMDLTMMAVNPRYASQGLATRLVELTVARARRQLNVTVWKTEAVSEYAARALFKSGFQTIHEIPYDQFSYNGSKPLAPLAQSTHHKKGRLMVLTL